MSYPEEAKRFVSNIEHHRMSVLHDDGLYRHIRFQQPGRGAYWFELLTWPGHLTVTGDMGTFTFARVPDMLEFFLTGGDINPQYWAEKALGAKSDVEAYSPDRFRDHVLSAIEDVERALDGLQEEVERQVLVHADEEDCARRAVEDFEHGGFTFTDTWDWNLFGYSYRYLWCCFAIRWGAEQYQAAKVVAA